MTALDYWHGWVLFDISIGVYIGLASSWLHIMAMSIRMSRHVGTQDLSAVYLYLSKVHETTQSLGMIDMRRHHHSCRGVQSEYFADDICEMCVLM